MADLGGGDGFFLAQVLQQHPETTGHLLDLPWMAEKAKKVLAEHAVADRVEIRAEQPAVRTHTGILRLLLHQGRAA
ncbi:methyltransferase [Streptomyces lasalocidi]